MVCEHKVVCPAPLLSSANEWTPIHGAVKVTVTYDGFIHIKNVSQSLDPVYEDVCTCITLPFSIVSLWFSVSGSVSLTVLRYEYAHM